MNFFRIVFELFALYILYRVIFDFIIPVARSTKQVKKQFAEMNRQMQEKMNRQAANNSYSNTPTNNQPARAKSDDYIDFEEVK